MTDIPTYTSVEHWQASLQHEVFMIPEPRQLVPTRAEAQLELLVRIEQMDPALAESGDMQDVMRALLVACRGKSSPILIADTVSMWRRLTLLNRASDE